MSAELLPCPFCGGSGEFIQCIHHACAASSMLIFPTMADAKPLLIEKWNRRPPASGERVALTEVDEMRVHAKAMDVSRLQGRLEAFAMALTECGRTARREGDSVGARDSSEIRTAIDILHLNTLQQMEKLK